MGNNIIDLYNTINFLFHGQIVLHTDLFLFLLRSLGSVSDGWSPDIMGPLSLLMLSSSEK